jgi:hypothetical protein
MLLMNHLVTHLHFFGLLFFLFLIYISFFSLLSLSDLEVIILLGTLCTPMTPLISHYEILLPFLFLTFSFLVTEDSKICKREEYEINHGG